MDCWRRSSSRLLYTPFLQAARFRWARSVHSLQRFRFNDPIFATVERVVRPQVAAGLAVCSGLLTAVWLRYRRAEGSPDAWAWPMAASLAGAPVVYPWYLLWLVPFLQSASTLPLMIWTLSILPVFFVWYSHTLGQPWRVPSWILLLEYGPVITAAAIAWVRGRLKLGRLARPYRGIP